jgi:anaerobic selenocysteine-containing dehydrogenase/Fe-S-cluster-containing dehydrogenase component
MQTIKTICQMCYFYCGLDVTCADGKIVRIDGMKEHPVNRGSLCPKGFAAQHLVTDSNRLTHPLRRAGPRGAGQWKSISWDEALDTLATQLSRAKERHGPESVAYHRGHAPGWVTTMNYVTRFMNAFGSPNLLTHSHLCFKPRAAAHLVTYGGVPEPDFDRAGCILLWGFNPTNTSLTNYMRRIMNAKARGAKLIVVDPRFTKTAAKADLWLQPQPGTDLPLALGMSKVLVEEELYDREFVRDCTVGFDELQQHLAAVDLDEVARITGVSAERLTRAARMFADNTPAVMKEGNGLDQHANVTQTVRAVCLLPSLMGSLNIEGSCQLMPALPFVDVQLRSARGDDWEERSVSSHPLFYSQAFTTHDEDLFAALESGKQYPIEALIVQGGALLAANSNTARTRRLLEKIGFIAVHDLYMTATAEVADLVLPAASFLERDLLLYYRYRPSTRMNLVCLQQQVVAPVGESRSDLEMVFALAKKLGMGEAFPWRTVEEAFNWELSPLGITVDYLREHPEGYRRTYASEELYRTHGQTGFRTSSGKVELRASRLEAFGHDALPRIESVPPSLEASEEYPLLCGTGLKLGIHTHTEFHTLPWIDETEPAPFLEIHPRKANELGIMDRDRLRVVSAWGEVPALARFTEGVDENVVMLAYGYGQPYAHRAWRSSNDLTPHVDPDPISGATSNRRVPVRLVREASEERSPKVCAVTLALLVNLDLCVGCHTCEFACAQEHSEKRLRVNFLGPTTDARGAMAMEMIPIATERCDLCSARLARGEKPACVAACPTSALFIASVQETLDRIRSGRHQLCATRTIGNLEQ